MWAFQKRQRSPKELCPELGGREQSTRAFNLQKVGYKASGMLGDLLGANFKPSPGLISVV